MRTKTSGKIEYKRDKKGKLVTSKINRIILKDIANAGNGSFYHFSNNNDSHQKIKNDLDKMQKKTISTHEFSEYEERFQLVSLIALLLLLISYVYPTNIKKV